MTIVTHDGTRGAVHKTKQVFHSPPTPVLDYGVLPGGRKAKRCMSLSLAAAPIALVNQTVAVGAAVHVDPSTTAAAAACVPSLHGGFL